MTSKCFLFFPPFIPPFDGGDDDVDDDKTDIDDDGDNEDISDAGGRVDDELEDIKATPLEALDNAVDGGIVEEDITD